MLFHLTLVILKEVVNSSIINIFQTLLRIWDCFLLEGPKVLFRFAIVLIGKHEEEIISRGDAIGIMRVSKAATKLAFDEEAIVNVNYIHLNYF